MSKTQFSHIRVLLAGPQPVSYIAKDLPDSTQMIISSSEEKDPADDAKDPAEVATDGTSVVNYRCCNLECLMLVTRARVP